MTNNFCDRAKLSIYGIVPTSITPISLLKRVERRTWPHIFSYHNFTKCTSKVYCLYESVVVIKQISKTNNNMGFKHDSESTDKYNF